MNLNISAPKMQLTSALEAYVKEKIQKLGDHFQITNAHVRLESENNKSIAKLDLALKGKGVHIQESHHDMYAAIDKAVKISHETLTRQKHKKAAVKIAKLVE